MNADTNPEPKTIEEIDARIEEKLSILWAIDAQVADRAANVRSGDLEKVDFRGWLVRAMDKRVFVAGALATLRHRRHVLAGEEEQLRLDRARLREDVGRLKARLAQAEAEAVKSVASVHKMYEVDGVEALKAAHSEELRRKNIEAVRLRQETWTAKLDGEAALLNPTYAVTFLRRTANEIPPAFRDTYCERASRHGRSLPRSSAEVACCRKAEET